MRVIRLVRRFEQAEAVSQLSSGRIGLAVLVGFISVAASISTLCRDFTVIMEAQHR